ncbi:MAG: hypothetical protein ACRDRU_14590 [Pseudonocardiaceae bacterium]
MSPADDPDVTGRVLDDDESCPGCGGTTGVRRITGAPPTVVAGGVEPFSAVLLEVIVLAGEQSALLNAGGVKAWPSGSGTSRNMFDRAEEIRQLPDRSASRGGVAQR